MNGPINGAMRPEDTRTLYDLLENAGRLFGEKTFLRYEIDEVVYEKTYGQFVTGWRSLLRRRGKHGGMTSMWRCSGTTAMSICAR